MSYRTDDDDREIEAMNGLMTAMNSIGVDWQTRRRILDWLQTREQTLYEDSLLEEEVRSLKLQNLECARLLTLAEKEKLELEKELARVKGLSDAKETPAQTGPRGYPSWTDGIHSKPDIPKTTEPT